MQRSNSDSYLYEIFRVSEKIVGYLRGVGDFRFRRCLLPHVTLAVYQGTAVGDRSLRTTSTQFARLGRVHSFSGPLLSFGWCTGTSMVRGAQSGTERRLSDSCDYKDLKSLINSTVRATECGSALLLLQSSSSCWTDCVTLAHR